MSEGHHGGFVTHVRRTLVAVALLLSARVASAQLEITLKNSFIEEFSDRATITATFTVDKAHAQANTPKKDADLHVAGRAPEIGLATVAEIMNARTEPEAMAAIHDVEGKPHDR